MPDDPSNSNEPMVRIELQYPQSTAIHIMEAAALAGYSNPAEFIDSLVRSSLEQVILAHDGYEVVMVKDGKGHPYESPPLISAYENGYTKRATSKPAPTRPSLSLVVSNTP